ncbi:MAG: WYL domain-containing protein [Parasphingorhabdus sp.]|uniref:helix-turn-helix transcriptional regulator n=1 Tax=Alphaproteobacteria TaxID=28211 RepID=UPI003264F079
MNPIERALGILLLLTGGKLVTATTLSERFEVSLRTIYRDVDRLLALGIPIEAERGAEGGYRLEKGFLQPPVALTRRETAALLTALALVRGIRTIPLVDELVAAESKLVASLPKSVQPLLSEADRIIGIEPVPPDIFHAGTHLEPNAGWQSALDGFMSGLLASKRVRFDHLNPARPQPRAHDVEPYGVLFDRDLWYLVGRSVDADSLKIYRADRVHNIEVSGFRFLPDKTFSIGQFLGGAWLSQAMRRWEAERPSALIRVTAQHATKLMTDWYYRHAVFTPGTDGKVLISIPDVSRDRLFPLIRWLGPGAELIEPTDLREPLAAELEDLAAVHRAQVP